MNKKFIVEVLPKINFIKTIYYSLKFRGKIIVGWNVSINLRGGAKIYFDKSSSSLYLGVHFSAREGTVLDMYENSRLVIGKSVGIHRGCKIVVRENAELHIGDGTFINEKSRLQCAKKISIGHSTSIGWGCNILDTDLHGIYIDGELKNSSKEIEIGEKVWICANATILKGSTLKGNTVIGIGSVFLGGVADSDYIYAGNPAKKIKKFDSWGAL